MKTLKLAVLASAMLLAGTVTMKAQTADEIVNKYITAIGGEANWKKVNSMKMVGAMNMQGQEVSTTRTVVHGKGMRMDLDIMGMNNYVILTPKEGWQYFPVAGQTKPEAMTADDIKESQDQLDAQGELVDYKNKGCKVEYIGKDEVEGTTCHKLKFTDKAGIEKTMFFDASNAYLIRQTQKMKANGQEMEAVYNFSNYQKVADGLVIPMTVGAPEGEITFKTVEINKITDESLFKPAN